MTSKKTFIKFSIFNFPRVKHHSVNLFDDNFLALGLELHFHEQKLRTTAGGLIFCENKTCFSPEILLFFIHKGINRHCFTSTIRLKCQLSHLIPRNGIMTSASCQNLHVRLIRCDKQTRWFSNQMSVNQRRASLKDIIFGKTITLEMF